MKEHSSNVPLFQTDYWNIFLMPYQAYLGRCVVVLKRNCGDLGDITTEELLDFHNIVKRLENVFKKTFNATMFNWNCLMNNAYQNTPPDPLVHWHFRPRYNHSVLFEGYTFEDPHFGYHYDRAYEKAKGVYDKDILNKIAEAVKTNL